MNRIKRNIQIKTVNAILKFNMHIDVSLVLLIFQLCNNTIFFVMLNLKASDLGKFACILIKILNKWVSFTKTTQYILYNVNYILGLLFSQGSDFQNNNETKNYGKAESFCKSANQKQLTNERRYGFVVLQVRPQNHWKHIQNSTLNMRSIFQGVIIVHCL